MDSAIKTQGLRKVYGQKVAVRRLTLEVPRGEVFGFLGPNGAGKTTSIRILLGLAAPSAGRAWVAPAAFEGRDVLRICATHGETNAQDVRILVDALDAAR